MSAAESASWAVSLCVAGVAGVAGAGDASRSTAREAARRRGAPVELVPAARLDGFPFADTADGRYARSWLGPMGGCGAEAWVSNVETELFALRVGDAVLPVTVNDREYDSSYVVSPFTHYVTYAKEEVRLSREMKGKGALCAAFDALGLLLRATRINKTVHVNNWLLSTNLYPELDPDDLGAITAVLRERFPEHAIVFRSVNPRTMGPLHDAFPAHGYRLLMSRRVYMVDPASPELARNRRSKADSKLAKKAGYERVRLAGSVPPEDLRRLVELYDHLYLNKYSQNNPAFTEAFLGHAIEHGLLDVHVFRKDGRIDAVVGTFDRNGVMTAPLVGYDPAIPQEVGLYRMLMVTMFEQAKERGLLLNMSAGAGEFKRLRGGVPNFEYSAVLVDHLPLWRQLGWRALEAILGGFAMDLVEKYDR